jgi:glycosyltransferase involved in cell wall biosynthesis
MNLLFITPSYTLGGVETQSFHLAEYFIQNGHKVTFVCIRGEEGPLYQKLTRIGADCHFFRNLSDLNKVGLYGKLKIIFSFIRFLRKLKPTIILPFTEPINTIVNVFRPFTGAKKALFTMRGGTIISGPQSKFKRFVNYSKPIYISNSKHGAKLQANYLGIAVSKFNVIRNGIKMDIPLKTRAEWRSDLNLAMSDTVFVMVANFYSEKKHSLLLEAWGKFEKGKNGVKLLLLGDKSPFDRDYFKAKAFILDNKLYDSVIQITGNKDVSGILKACDSGVLLTDSEGCPNSLLEYMSSEISVIASNIPAITEVIGDDYPFLTKNDSLESVISALEAIYSNRTDEKLIQRNLKIVQTDYTYEHLVYEYDKLLQIK